MQKTINRKPFMKPLTFYFEPAGHFHFIGNFGEKSCKVKNAAGTKSVDCSVLVFYSIRFLRPLQR